MDFLFDLLPALASFIVSTFPSAGPWILGIGVVCMVLSVLASGVNKAIQSAADAGVVLPSWALQAAAVANVLALNFDKASRLLKGYRGPAAPPTKAEAK